MAFQFSWDTCVGSVERSYDRYRVVLPLPEKKFLPETDRRIAEQQLAVSIECSVEFEYPGHTLRPPPLRQLNEFYSGEIAFDPFKLRVEQAGVALMIDAHEAFEHLYPIPEQKLLAKVFEFVGLHAEPSKPGLLATRIVEQLGDIEGGRVFKIAGVRKLIQNRRADEALPHSTAIQIIQDGDGFGKYENLFIESRKHHKLRKQDVFNYLLKKDFFRAGLDLTCGRCALNNWLALRDIDDVWRCQYCGHEDRLALHIRHRGDWKFRKSGLLAKDNNQEGAIPVILSLLVFKRIVSHSPTLFSTALSLATSERTCEIDYAAFHYGRDKQLEMAIGEAKSGGGLVDENDIENMRFVLDKFVGENITGYLVFSKTQKEFTEQEIVRFKALFQDRVPIILLTNKELEPYRPYEEEEGEKLPHKYPHTFSEMAQNTAARYLR